MAQRLSRQPLRRAGSLTGLSLLALGVLAVPAAAADGGTGRGSARRATPATAATPATVATPATPATAAAAARNRTRTGRHGHAKVFPTREATDAQNQSPEAATEPAGSGALIYSGGVNGVGVTRGAPKVYVVFWGSQWGKASTTSTGALALSGDSKSVAPRLQAMLKGLGTNNETWSGVMTQYCEGVAQGATSCPSTATHVSYPTGGAFAGVWADPSAVAPAQATAQQIAAEAVKAAGHFGNTAAGSNRNNQYVIVSPPATHPDGFNTGSATSNFCAWHDWNGDTQMSGGAAASSYGDIAFTNLPYIPDAGASCGAGYVNGAAGPLDGFTIVSGHEYAETITDQNPAGGWIDSLGNENADKCSWVGVGGSGGAQNLAFSTGTFAMQATWSNQANSCEISHPVVTNASLVHTVTVTGPGAQTTTVGAATRLQLTAKDSAGSALTYTARGLPAGLSISTAGLVSGTPTATGSSAVTVSATDSAGATGSTSFTWTIAAVGACPTQAQRLGNPGFESAAAAPWSTTPGVVDTSTAQPAHSGLAKAWLDGYGSTHTDTLSQTVSLPLGCSAYTLSFWMHVSSADTSTTAHDTLTVRAGTTTLATYSNLDRNTGYAQRTLNLSAFAGQTVSLAFTGAENALLQTSFVLDDAAVATS